MQSRKNSNPDYYLKKYGMFTRRKNPDINLSIREPNATKYGHVKSIKVQDILIEMQGSCVISRMDPKTYRKIRLIAISKSDGRISPIGMGEIIRRAITKALAEVAKEDVKITTGSVQFNGLPEEFEAAINTTDTACQIGKSASNNGCTIGF